MSLLKKEERDYVSYLSDVMLEKNPRHSRILLWLIFITVVWFIVWAYYAKIDEITKGEGKVIPSSHVKVIQNLEGGILEEIYVKEGDVVKKGDKLLKISDVGFASKYKESEISINSLKAKAVRLYAEAHGKPFNPSEKLKKEIPKLLRYEKNLYESDIKEIKNKEAMIEDQITQKTNELKEAYAKRNKLKTSYELIKNELSINEPLVKKGIVSQVEFLKLKRQANDIKGDLNAVSYSIPKIKAQIEELKRKKKNVYLEFQNKAKEEYNEIVAKISALEESKSAIEDKVKRTLVLSPVNGIIKKIYVNTIGGAITPAMDLMEIVPNEDSLLIEAKIKPSDIAFIRPGLKAKVKFTAYDFSIYGALEGEVVSISADTIQDEKGDSYYIVRIKTNKNHLGTEEKPLKIIPGMVAKVEIITGKKSILDYILKPLLKTKENALRER